MKEYIKSQKITSEAFEKEAITLCGNESYLIGRNRKKKHPAEESCRENIRRIFIEIIDNIVESLENKIVASLLR